MLKKKYILAFPLVLFVAACGSGGLGGSVSLDEEWQLGNQAAAQVEQQVRLVNDAQATAYLRMVGHAGRLILSRAKSAFHANSATAGPIESITLRDIRHGSGVWPPTATR